MKFKVLLFLSFILSPIYSQVGIGTTNPQQQLHISGSQTGLQTLRIDDLAVTTGGTNPGELTTTIISANKALYTDARGDLYSRYILGDNTQSLIISGSQNINDTNLTDITGASITFTPRHSTVFLSFSVSGDIPASCINSNTQESWFAVGVSVNGSNIANFSSMSASTNSSSSTITVAQLPVSVSAGSPVTINLQGRDGGAVHDCGFTIDSTNLTSYMTITD
ncbi:hypothetical protein [Pseudofulvibacter geojedonensis]|uniref:Uncharacterized protein n=1 Tax=Pseudofulvibacter geojedonensis TaxID=1123758 RepID=A0ABW3I1L7_9FLAO